MDQGAVIFHSQQESVTFAHKFAANLKTGAIVALTGDLGAGKTFLCREIIKYFCGNNTKVTSPTFNLLQTYQTYDFIIYHFDLYRLKSPEEIYELGLEEALNNNICLIEWPEIITHILPKSLINIHLEIIEEDKRLCRISYS